MKYRIENKKIFATSATNSRKDHMEKYDKAISDLQDLITQNIALCTEIIDQFGEMQTYMLRLKIMSLVEFAAIIFLAIEVIT